MEQRGRQDDGKKMQIRISYWSARFVCVDVVNWLTELKKALQ